MGAAPLSRLPPARAREPPRLLLVPRGRHLRLHRERDDGRDLNEVWAGRPEAYLGTTVSGFPNMFVLYGPNTNHGSGSVPYTLECQFDYVIDAIERVREGGFRWIELRPETQAAW